MVTLILKIEIGRPFRNLLVRAFSVGVKARYDFLGRDGKAELAFFLFFVGRSFDACLNV